MAERRRTGQDAPMVRLTSTPTSTSTSTSTLTSTAAARAASTTTTAAATPATTTATTTARLDSVDAGAPKAAVTGRSAAGASWPKHLSDELALLGEASRQALTKLLFLHGNSAVGEAIVAQLESPSLWCVPMRPNDEARVLAKAIEAVPLSTTAAKTPSSPIATVHAIEARTDGKTAVDNALPRLQAAWDKGGDVVVAPEWFFVPAHGVAMSVVEKDALVQRLAQLTVGSDRLLVPGTLPWADDDGGYHNTAFAFSNGEVVHSVDKRGDGDDVDIAKSAGLHHVSDDGGSTFAWRGVTVGLEVCRDHGDARLRWELLGTNRDVVDLQVVVSSGVWLKHAAVGVGGQVVVAQGDGIAGAERGHRDGTGRLHVDPLVQV